MILVRIILRSANGGPEEILGEATITNDGTGSSEVANYDVTLFRGARYSSRAGTVWKRGRVQGFIRKLGPWRLLRDGLVAALGRVPHLAGGAAVSIRVGEVHYGDPGARGGAQAVRLYDGLPEPCPCEGCGFTTCRCKPASRPVPEPLSQVLRRLHEEAMDDCLCGLPTCKRCVGRSLSLALLRRAGYALSDLVAAVEWLAETWPLPVEPVEDCDKCRVRAALAALRERLGAKP